MDLIEQLKLFCAEKNLTFMEDVVEIKAKMTSVAVNSSSVRPNWKVSSSIKWQHTRKQILKRLFKQPPTSLENGFLKGHQIYQRSPFNPALQTLTWPANWCSFTITTTPLLQPHFYGSVSGRNSEVPLHIG